MWPLKKRHLGVVKEDRPKKEQSPLLAGLSQKTRSAVTIATVQGHLDSQQSERRCELCRQVEAAKLAFWMQHIVKLRARTCIMYTDGAFIRCQLSSSSRCSAVEAGRQLDDRRRAGPTERSAHDSANQVL